MQPTDVIKLSHAVEQPYCFDGIVADPELFLVWRQGEVLDLEPKALRVLFCLIRHRGRVLTKHELLAEVWAGAFVSDNSLTRVVAQLRKQLGDSARLPRYIETCSTVGYRFIGHLEPAAEPKTLLPWILLLAVVLGLSLPALWMLK